MHRGKVASVFWCIMYGVRTRVGEGDDGWVRDVDVIRREEVRKVQAWAESEGGDEMGRRCFGYWNLGLSISGLFWGRLKWVCLGDGELGLVGYKVGDGMRAEMRISRLMVTQNEPKIDKPKDKTSIKKKVK